MYFVSMTANFLIQNENNHLVLDFLLPVMSFNTSLFKHFVPFEANVNVLKISFSLTLVRRERVRLFRDCTLGGQRVESKWARLWDLKEAH